MLTLSSASAAAQKWAWAKALLCEHCGSIGAQTCRNLSLPRGFAWAEKGVARVTTLRGSTPTVKCKLASLENEQLETGHYPKSALANSGQL
jgi:hypothetical protein